MSFSIEHVAIRCRDIESSIDYFTRMFDAEIMFRRQLDQGKQIVFMHIGDSMLELMDIEVVVGLMAFQRILINPIFCQAVVMTFASILLVFR